MKKIKTILENLLREGYKTGDNPFETGRTIGNALRSGKLRKGKTKEQAEKQAERIGGKVADRGKKGMSRLTGMLSAAAREARFNKGFNQGTKTMESIGDIKEYIRNLLEGDRSGGSAAVTGMVVGKTLRLGKFRKGKSPDQAREQADRIGKKIEKRGKKSGDLYAAWAKGRFGGARLASQYPESYTPVLKYAKKLLEGVTSGGDPILTGMRVAKAKTNPKKTFANRMDQESRIGDKIASRVAKRTGQEDAGARAWGKYTGAKFATKYGNLNPKDLRKMSEAIVALYKPFINLIKND